MSAYKEYMKSFELSDEYKSALLGKLEGALSEPAAPVAAEKRRSKVIKYSLLSAACAAAVCLIAIPAFSNAFRGGAHFFDDVNGGMDSGTPPSGGDDYSQQECRVFGFDEVARDILGNTLCFDEIKVVQSFGGFAPPKGSLFICLSGEAHFTNAKDGEYFSFTSSEFESLYCALDDVAYELAYRQDIFEDAFRQYNEVVDGRVVLVFEVDEAFVSHLAEARSGALQFSLSSFRADGKYTLFDLSLDQFISSLRQ